MEKHKLALIIFFLLTIHSFGQEEINLTDKFKDKNIRAVNRVLSLYGDAHNTVEMNAKKGDGLSVLEDIEFEKRNN